MDDETTNNVIKAIERTGGEEALIHLSTGVILRAKPANQIMLIKAISSTPAPRPPEYRDKIMGRDTVHYDDPDYIAAMKTWRIEQGNMTLTALILLGTEIHSIPKGMLGPDPVEVTEGTGKNKKKVVRDWLDEEYSVLGLPMRPDSKKWRYQAWVLTQACVTQDDIKKVQEVVSSMSGVTNTDMEAAKEFPGSQKADI